MTHLHFETIDSTMFEADRLIASGLNEATVLIADAQTGGHGRYGRAWQSPPGNLYWTAVVPLDASFPKDATVAPLTALAVVDTLTQLDINGSIVHVKWPNDTLINEQKVSGVLIKRSSSAVNTAFSSYLVVGIGINVHVEPTNVAFPATCLRNVVIDLPTPSEIGVRLTQNFEVRLNQWKQGEFPTRKAEYEGRLYRMNEVIELSFDRDRTERVSGVNRGVDGAGALQLQLPDGQVKSITIGEVMPI